jgi:hypothetical protein
MLVQPWPLQLFWPLQELLAPLQAPVPLHELAPAHLTLVSAFLPANAEPAANIEATAPAIIAPFKVLLDILVFSLVVDG